MILFGDKTVALFDLWSFEHFFTGCNSALFAAFLVRKFYSGNDDKIFFKFQVLILAVLEIYWESLEYYLEDGASYDVVTYWFQGVEYIGNRLITDPIVTIAGLFFIRKFPKIKYFSIPFSLIWLYVHIFVFNHCMAVQDLMYNYFGIVE